MINVAFILNFTKEYKGGINYIKNLLYACSLEKHSEIRFFVFLSTDIEQEYIDIFSPYAQIIKTDILKRRSIPWFFEKILEKKFNINFLLLRLLKKHKINVVSHSNFFSRYKNLKLLNWIPDFQILHYPELWSDDERKRILDQYHSIVKYSDGIVLSSNDAFKDYKSFTSDNINKVRVLQFVSQPGTLSETEFSTTKAEIEKKYGIDREFFYLPNQFWSHKNHITAFKAIRILKEKGLNPLLVTTGHMADYRNNNNLQKTLDFVKENDLDDNILLLGLIPYSEVLVLIKACTTLINPSLFEGWSSTVEEAKSSNKLILLSDIPIHREQNPASGIYFDPLDENYLADIMEKVMIDDKGFITMSGTDEQVKHDLISRTKIFAQKYNEIIIEVTKNF